MLPSATETLFAIGAGGEVVGVTHECDFPPAASTLPRVTSSSLPGASSAAEIDRHVRRSLHLGSSLYDLDSQLLEKLQPDLIVTQELCKVCAVAYEVVDRAARRLASDPRIVSLEPSSLEDLYANISTLGEMTGHQQGAALLVASLREREARLRGRTANPRRVQALVLEWTDPPMSAGHWTPELVQLAGADPVLANPGENSRTMSWEEIARADPDAIVVAPCGFDFGRTVRAIDDLGGNDSWRALRAVRAGRVYPVDGNAFVNRPGPRLLDSAEIFARLLN